ncbi:hypothetical protein [Qipengyuania qiaonensis]|uniref:Transposase n=1 Tax=Qipengyuania qiaonensis TaxID=2867240 RepID=A0ABS7J2K4_9SPHN|nr:hypothetical protein [Qipengyuania qiaonensis]MBX7481128.1 hypothetical protein [Qipengyuania qiaonensis]
MPDTIEPLAHVPARGWTPELKARFLDRLAAHGNARAACRAVNLSAEAAYRLRRRDTFFARGWAAALILARENGVQALAERAIEGVEEQIYYRGELVGTRRRYDARLLLAHLARLDALADEEGAGADASRFDELLASVAGGAEDLPPERKDAIVEAAEAARENYREAELDAFYGSQEIDDREDDDDSPLDEVDVEYFGALEEECDEIAERARASAEQEWDLRLANTFDSIDALCGWPGSPTAPGLPCRSEDARPDPAAIAAAIALACPQPAAEPSAEREFSFLGTVSTVSTSALARTLAGPPPGYAMTPRSPFGAPRNTTGR